MRMYWTVVSCADIAGRGLSATLLGPEELGAAIAPPGSSESVEEPGWAVGATRAVMSPAPAHPLSSSANTAITSSGGTTGETSALHTAPRAGEDTGCCTPPRYRSTRSGPGHAWNAGASPALRVQPIADARS